MNELVSIVIPNYNYGLYIRQAIESAVNQSYKNIEIIIIDDCSTDNSVEIINEYVEKYNNIKLFVNDKNMGVVATHNRCIELSNGEYITVLSSDDYIHSQFIEKSIKKLREYPTAAMVATDLSYVDNDNNVTYPNSFYPNSFFCKGIYQCKIWMFTNTFVPSQVLFRRKCIEDPEIGGMFSYLADTFIDTELWFRMCLKYDFVYLKERLCYYRMHIGSYSKSYENFKSYLQFYLARRRFAELSRNIPLLNECADEAILRSTRMGTRSIRILIDNEKYELAEQYLHITEGLDPGIRKHPYYECVMTICNNKSADSNEKEMLLQYEISYNDSCKKEENRGKNVSAPYELPECVELI